MSISLVIAVKPHASLGIRLRNLLAVPFGMLLAACGAADMPEPVSEPVVQQEAPAASAEAPVERVSFTYEPMGEVAEAYGALSIMLPVGNEGPGRTLVFGNGAQIETTLLSSADIALPLGQVAMSEAIGVTQTALENDGAPKVYMLSVQSEIPGAGDAACGTRPLSALLLRQPESPTDQTVTIVFLTALPTDPAVEICKRAVFMTQ